MCLINIVLFLAAVGSVIAQYHVQEDQQQNGYDSPLPLRGSLTGATFVGGKGIVSHNGGGRRKVYPPVKYVTPASTSYGEPVEDLYSGPTSYYGAGEDHGVHSYRKGHGDLAGRVKIQVYRGPTVKSDYTEYAPWGYYVIQPSDGKSNEHSYGY